MREGKWHVPAQAECLAQSPWGPLSCICGDARLPELGRWCDLSDALQTTETLQHLR